MSNKVITKTVKGFSIAPSQEYLDKQSKIISADIQERIEAKLDLLFEKFDIKL